MATYDSHYGPVHKNVRCKDDFENIVIYHQDAQRIVKLQRPAIESFKVAEEKLGHKIHLTGSGWRSCALQTQLHNSDPSRFAVASSSLHCAGLAVDLDTNDPHFVENKRALLNHGWHFPRPDEIWHVSYRIEG